MSNNNRMASPATLYVLRNTLVVAALVPHPSDAAIAEISGSYCSQGSTVQHYLRGAQEPQSSTSANLVDPTEQEGWRRLLSDVNSWCRTGEAYTNSDGEIVTAAAFATLHRVLPRVMQNLSTPSVWGSDEWGGIFVEQHGETTVMLRISADGGARLSTFRGTRREGPATIL